jgi:hypothetical protein
VEALALPSCVCASRAANLALELFALYAAIAKEDKEEDEEEEDEEEEEGGEEEPALEHQPELEANLEEQALQD